MIGQDDTFSVVPKAVNIVPAGETVELECITREPVSCAWKLEGTELGASGFLVSISVSNYIQTRRVPGGRGAFCLPVERPGRQDKMVILPPRFPRSCLIVNDIKKCQSATSSIQSFNHKI